MWLTTATREMNPPEVALYFSICPLLISWVEIFKYIRYLGPTLNLSRSLPNCKFSISTWKSIHSKFWKKLSKNSVVGLCLAKIIFESIDSKQKFTHDCTHQSSFWQTTFCNLFVGDWMRLGWPRSSLGPFLNLWCRANSGRKPRLQRKPL